MAVAVLLLAGGAAAGAFALGLLGAGEAPRTLRQVDLGALEPPGEGLLDSDVGDTACERLALVAAGLGEKTGEPGRLLRRLGRVAAGIHDPPRAFVDLARGGIDLIPGAGFRDRFDDGTDGQARHFAGVAVATSYGGARQARLVSIFVREDSPSSADGQLTDAAIEFARLLRGGELAAADAGDWILAKLCRPG